MKIKIALIALILGLAACGPERGDPSTPIIGKYCVPEGHQLPGPPCEP